MLLQIYTLIRLWGARDLNKVEYFNPSQKKLKKEEES